MATLALGYPCRHRPNAQSAGCVAQRTEQRVGGLFEKELLRLAADLNERDVREPGFPVRSDGVDDRVEVRAAGDGIGDVFGSHELGRTGETGRCGQVGVDLPAAAKPAELVMREE